MSAYAAFRRQPVPQQFAQNLQTITIPAPTRGIIQSENEAFMQPGGSVVQTNWATTMKGVKVRGGYERWCDLGALPAPEPVWVTGHAYVVGDRVIDNQAGTNPAADPWECITAHTSTGVNFDMNPANWVARTTTGPWQNEHAYFAKDRAVDETDGSYWRANASHTSPAFITFADARAASPGQWTVLRGIEGPVISAFEFIGAPSAVPGGALIHRMYAAQPTALYEVTERFAPTLIKSGQNSGNYSAAQMNNNAGISYLIVVNDAGDFALRTKDGEEFFLLSGVVGNAGDGIPNITYDPAKLPVYLAQGTGLVYVWAYRNRLYFIQKNSMNAWYLDIDAVGGVLKPIYLAGAAARGGRLLFGATWSIDAGDGTDDKCVFVTSEGEVLIFTGSNPSDAANWRQEGRYQIGAPLGMNAHTLLGGDLIILTVDGAVPLSQAISKDSGAIDLALLTKNIKPSWREDVADKDKRNKPWTIRKWDEYGGIFVAAPGGTKTDTKHCWVANNATGAWFKYTWDATCWLRLKEFMFFGTLDGLIMWADQGGNDDGRPYVATLVGGWETFQSGSGQVTWHQARAIFLARTTEPFQPQITSCVDYVVAIPQPPPIGPDKSDLGIWDEGTWDNAIWDAGNETPRTTRNTLWVSIGTSGFAHAPVVQAQIKQNTRPTVELIAIGTTQERGGVNV